MIKGIHHIAFVVKDIEKAIAFYQTKLGFALKKRTYFQPRGIEVALFDVKGVLIELIQPVEQGTPPYKFLKEQGEGFFHIAYDVYDIKKGIQTLEDKRVKMMNKKPIQGLDWDVAWIGKEETMGVFMQLVDRRRRIEH